ncbi:DoxX family protein [Luteolibacter sp. LG18]|uniref:DoxX family protein n=1 Tax=Luteolibacter sp. LG18 TaxID=2819286 RepID=UPI002B30C2BD|nr:hypothetical protein llg_24560 [Luteolibacter sp. LG18]
MKKLFFDCGTRDATASVGLFVLRAGTGLMMLLGHGLPKLHAYDKLKANWPTANIWPLSHLSSEISLICTLVAEIGAAALLVLGLMTRPAAFIFGFAMVVAAFQIGAHEPWFMGPDAPTAKEPALLYLLPAVVLILTGAGSWSFDAALYREGKRKRW